MRLAVLDFGPLPMAGMRVAIAALVLWPLMLLRGHGPLLRQHWKPALFVGVLNSALPFACYGFALMHISTGLSSILNATVPLFAALVAWAWLGDRPQASRVLGLVLGFSGIALLMADSAGFKPGGGPASASDWPAQAQHQAQHPVQYLAMAACLLATLCYALAASFAKRHLDGVPPLVTATGSQIGATLGLALPTLLLWPAAMPGPSAWLAIVAVGVVCTGLAYVLYFRLIELAGPARALSVTFLIPLFALLYGGVFLGEQITGWMLGCGAVIFLGTGLSSGLLKLHR